MRSAPLPLTEPWISTLQGNEPLLFHRGWSLLFQESIGDHTHIANTDGIKSATQALVIKHTKDQRHELKSHVGAESKSKQFFFFFNLSIGVICSL